MPESFSQRHRLAGPPAGTLLRDVVPVSFRMFLLNLLSKEYFNYHDMQKVICTALQVWPVKNVAPYYDCERHIRACEWFRIYEIIEGLYKCIHKKINYLDPTLEYFVRDINKAFFDENIGWKLVNGKVVTRGDEAFEGTMTTAVSVLAESQKVTAARHLSLAMNAMSARPKPNTSGAVAHATSAVECVLGEITGETMTLGKYLDKHPDLFHAALKKSLDGIYGYASDAGARHGKEGIEPAIEEARFVVAACAAVCTLLNGKHPK